MQGYDSRYLMCDLSPCYVPLNELLAIVGYPHHPPPPTLFLMLLELFTGTHVQVHGTPDSRVERYYDWEVNCPRMLHTQQCLPGPDSRVCHNN